MSLHDVFRVASSTVEGLWVMAGVALALLAVCGLVAAVQELELRLPTVRTLTRGLAIGAWVAVTLVAAWFIGEIVP